ncbi:MAG: nickel transporter [Rhodocyclaceae bacterium]|nr:nickel transporter [Rhodocyclaceae bacterium]
MKLIPVMDLKAGCVVRAVQGDRERYRPIVSGLCGGHEPVTVARALLDCSGADVLYLADLDALTGGERQAVVITTLLEALPDTRLWLDAAFRDRADWLALQAMLGGAASRVQPVYASEALSSGAALTEAFDAPASGILSLDTRGGEPLDAGGCWQRPDAWPGHVIVMTLDRVGSGGGPDLATLARIRRRRPDVRVVGAGGIRDKADLTRAAATGAWAWLVASALHDRRIVAVGHGVSLF